MRVAETRLLYRLEESRAGRVVRDADFHEELGVVILEALGSKLHDDLISERILVPSEGVNFDVPDPRVGFVRYLPSGKLILVSGRHDRDPYDGEGSTAWVVNRDGSGARKFGCGDCVSHLVVTRSGEFWASYEDEGLYSGGSPSSDGLVKFDAEGRPLVKAGATLERKEVHVSLHGLADDGRGGVWTLTCDQPRLLHFGARGRLVQTIRSPDGIHHIEDLAAVGPILLFVGPAVGDAGHKDGVFEWSPLAPGRHPKPVGLPGLKWRALTQTAAPALLSVDGPLVKWARISRH